ncbi:MAG: right-handed parallel beta-helix repeat-containing protein [Planctomycetes bacterium]|nr:right-handed parallel beta-helix repeat-containing protein [Planctomycetota bacterium]
MKYGKLYGAVTLVCLAMVLSIGLIWAEEYDPDDISTWPHDGYHNAFEATGTEFVISGNPYFPDLKITSKEEVHIVLEAFQDMVSYHIEAVDTNKHQTKITIEGLDGFFTGEESGKLYRHEDGAFEDSFKLKKHNATYTYHQDIRKAHHVYIMPEHGTVYIGIEANGGTPPPTPPYNYDSGSRTYTLTQNILDYVVITANNITLDGGGYYISGTNTGYGIYLNSNTNVTLTDCTVQYFYVGIYVSGGSTNTIASSTSITNQNSCICLYNTDYNTVSGCAASKSVASNGIVLTGGADYNTISDSSSSGNAYNGIAISNNALNNTVTGCVVNGNSSNGMYINCNYSTLTDNTCSSNTNLGIAVYGARYNSVTYNTCYGNGTSGIGLPSGTSNTVVANNTCTGNSWDGIRLWNANYNTVTTNTCQSNTVGGIGILSCSGKSLTITGNSLISNAYGVTMSNNATTTSILVYQNNIFNNTTWNAYSTDAINLYWYNSATQQNEGNFWGHVIEPAFTAGPGAGADTNAANVTNDYAYLVKNGWLLGYAPHEEINLPSARGAGSDGLSPRISDANATVDLASGNVNLAVPLTYIVPVDGLPTNVVIYGNSIPATDNPSSPLGYNWTHTFNMRLIIQTDGSIIQVTESGREILFWKDGESPAHWVSYPHYGLYRTITIDSSTGNYVLTNKDRTTLTFYPNGKFYKAQDLNNHTVTATYDPNGDLNYVTLANGMVIYFDVDSGTHCINELYIKNQSGSPISSSVTDFDYTSGVLTGATKNGGAWAWGWSYNYNQVTQTSPESYNNRVFNMTGNKCTSITGPLNEDITIVYHANPDHTVVTGRTGKVDDVYTNAQLGVWTRWIDEETSRGFDSSRNVITETKPSGATTYWAYDSRGNVLSTTNAAGANTQYLYGDSTNPDLPTEIGNALGITTTRTYSTAGQLTQEIEDYGTGKLNRKTTWEYYTSNETSDAAVIGQLYKHHRDPDTLNLTTTYNYDSNGYGIKETVTDGGTFSLVTGERVTNDIGWITTSYNVDYPSYIANNVATVYEYDERGNRILETDPNGIETASEYDLLDRCTSRTVDSTGLNLVTTWAYNWGGVTEQHIDPSGLNISSYTEYDAAGKVISRTDAAGALTEYYYYPNARLWKTKRQLTAAPDYAWTEYFYDVNGNQTGILDAGNHAISMTYDSVDRLVTTTDVASSTTVQYGFDLLGRQTYTIDARGNQSWTFYNNVNEVTHMRSAESTMGVYITTAYAYDAVGRRTQVIGPWYDTDGDGIADAGEYVNPTIGTINAPVAYTEYDPADRVTRTYINNTSTTDAKYYYDAMGDRSIHYVETLVDSATSSYQMVSSQYNKNKQVYLTALDPMGTLNEQTYHYFDNAGRQTAATAAYGSAVSTTSYSILDKASRVITSYVSSTLYATGCSYNARGQVLTTTDAE